MRNLISGNRGNGIYITGTGSCNNIIQGNWIGLDASGRRALTNAYSGIYISGPGNLIGGSTRSEGNVIAASRNNGISLNSEAHDTTISGNFIGTDADGSNALPNLGHGISVGSTGNTIGGPGEEGNLISGNGQCGLVLASAADSNSVWGNWIGLDASGQAALPNGGSGVDVYSSHNDIGGTSTNYGNIISGNQHDGICLESQAHDNRIWHNRIGPAADGTTLIGNQEDGIRFNGGGTSNTIGAINHPNYIAGNGGCGINLFFAGTGNSISDNRIYDNASLGISFNNGTPTANDAGDADTGSNNQQNYPVLNSATSDGTRIYFSGTLDSLPSTQFRIEIFGSRGGDTSGYGEGERRLTYFYTTTDAGGRRLSPMTALSAERRPITSAPPPRATTGSPRTLRNSATGSSSIPTGTDWATASKWSTSAVMPARFPMPTATATASPTTGSLRPTPVPRMQAITHTSAASNGLPTSSSVCPARSTASTRSRDVPTSMPAAPGR